ncbi:hypothetical protein GCM10020000_68290 [Streptomyces olivoverticillatus]
MGAVGVHFHQDAVAVVQAPAEARQIGGPQPLLALPVQHLDVVVVGGQLVGELAGAVGTVVVGDEDVRLRYGLPYPGDDGLDVLRLVVGRNDHQGRAERTETPLTTVVHC